MQRRTVVVESLYSMFFSASRSSNYRERALMVLVDYGGSTLPVIAHAPWNGLHLADFVMPMFLFTAGVSLAIVYKKIPNRYEATWKAIVKAAKLFLLGVFLQGGYLHGITSLTYGVAIEKIRLFGHPAGCINTITCIPRIAIGYIAAAVCEIWLPCQTFKKEPFFRVYIWHWCAVILLSAIYMGLTYGLYVADWKFKDLYSLSSLISENGTTIHTVRCSNRGDLGPGCNAAGMIDRYVLGILHLYQKSAYRNLEECSISKRGQVSDSSPSWCYAPFEPEGILSSLTASVACIIGLQYGHILGFMGSIINKLAPNPELSPILKSMNIQMPNTSTSSTSTVNQKR
ncbi:hypothetical protein LXL04_037120 [Taraxacum kok-saghyz]